MWTSRIASLRSRKVLVRRSLEKNYVDWRTRWAVASNFGDSKDEDLDCYNQRRCLSTGRRHGWKGDKGNPNEKKNFAKQYLEPAARGELKEKHSSGIPKLSVRKHKGHSIHRGQDEDLEHHFGGDYESEIEQRFEDGQIGTGDLVATMSKDISRARAARQKREPVKFQLGPGVPGVEGSNLNTVMPLPSPSGSREGVYTLHYDNGRRNEYWREEDYDDDGILTEEHHAFIRELVESLGEGNDTSLAGGSDEFDFENFDFDSLDLDAINDFEHENETAEEETSSNTAEEAEGAKMDSDQPVATEDDGEQNMIEKDDNGFEEADPSQDVDEDDMIPEKIKADAISPLIVNGPTGEDFWGALETHPTMYAEVRHHRIHRDSKREPIPYRPRNRVNPDPEFVECYTRWLYVTGLPPALSEDGLKFDKRSSLTTPQEQDIQKTVSKLLEVPSSRIFPANETSAFVGFDSPGDRETVLRRGPTEKVLSRSIDVAKYIPSGEDDVNSKFVKDADPNAIVKLGNLPPGRFSRDSLARDLFPESSELGAAYRISREQVVLPSPTSALIRFESADQADSAVASEKVLQRLDELGRYPVRFFCARRELVHKGMTGPLRGEEKRELGHRLLVDGDMPSRPLYLSHAGTIMLRGLDSASASKESLTEFFQPFSGNLRDEQGSIEFVTCEDGLPTGIAYVGFERLGEAEAVMKYFSGRTRIGDSVVHMKLVNDRKIPGLLPREQRSERTEEEILKSLNDWEQYVDPEDLKFLEKNGVAKVVIDEQLRGIRYQNRSFGVLDLAMRDEKLEPEKDSGDDYKELVRMYISTLKDCVATPENPGQMYELLHFPGEPIDLSVFDREKARQKQLMKKRGLQ